MSRNGSGTYTLPAGNPVVTGTSIASTWANNTMTDLANALTDSVAADGQTTMTGNLKMGANKIVNLADPTLAQDGATKAYVDLVSFSVAPSTAGNVLTSDGTAWTSAPPTPIPSGSLLMWPTGSAPAGYLLCDGTAVSRTTYAALFAIIGTTYGVGNGSNTFNIPDFRGRFPLGVSGSYGLATTGGSADAVVVSHTHTATSVVTDPSHSHNTVTINSFGAPIDGYAMGNTPTGGTFATNTATTGITVATTNTSTGVSGTGANLPPYLAINFVIKT
jgi:microcystin-dependent protein